MPTPGYLSQSLRRPLPTKDDGILRTVADAQFGAPRQLAAGKRQSHGRCAREGPAATAAPAANRWSMGSEGRRPTLTFALDARQVGDGRFLPVALARSASYRVLPADNGDNVQTPFGPSLGFAFCAKPSNAALRRETLCSHGRGVESISK
jgi:hypothetical protein